MQIKTLATGSTGNAYAISDGQTNLLLECGIPIRQLLRSSHLRLSCLAGCLITHEHGDHARAASDLEYYGVPLYTSRGTAQALGLVLPDEHILRAMAPTHIGTMTIMPFATEHNAAEPLGWLIYSHHTRERLLFATDTKRLDDYAFKGLDHIMVECNHMGLASMTDTNAYLADRVLRDHMSLDDCVNFLAQQDLSQVLDIRLIHISSSHGDPQKMWETVAAATGRRVIIARPE